ncbi:hypothetical protein OS493_004464 [Desmophyllum pertusum]|uniref:Guanylate-binding protein/Atlastin C-terminal domain-containing protein n=1 Tax=Desmophyllum pertusum TaxID=174260 RepID=A0A9W9ZFR5_9CNID|nr:hypothetical protein OS493_004464 [Desmophyllum pertusum]
MKTYNDFMMSELSPKLPCDSDEIRKCHNAAFARLESCFVLETAGLSTNTVEECFIQLKISMDETLEEWYTKNANSTRDSCNAVIENLRKQHLDPDINDAYDRFKEDYERFAIGAQDVIAKVFFDLQLKLNDDMKQFTTRLKSLKDYDKKLALEKAARAFQEQETERIKEEQSRLQQEAENRRNEMAHLIEKQNAEKQRFGQKMKNMADGHQEQMENMNKANEKTLKDEKGKADEEIQKLNQELLDEKEENGRNLREVQEMYANAPAPGPAPCYGQASFASPNTGGCRKVSLESKSASRKPQAEIMYQRTETARLWQQNSERKQRELEAVQSAKFHEGLLNTIAVGSAVVGAAACAAFPPAAPIIATCAAIVSFGAFLIGNVFN